jgi:hypothetical protein
MSLENVAIFRYYPMAAGQKIRIEGGPRAGDWEVIEVTERKVTLRCPITGRQFEWDRFCYFVEDRANEEWPQKD